MSQCLTLREAAKQALLADLTVVWQAFVVSGPVTRWVVLRDLNPSQKRHRVVHTRIINLGPRTKACQKHPGQVIGGTGGSFVPEEKEGGGKGPAIRMRLQPDVGSRILGQGTWHVARLV